MGKLKKLCILMVVVSLILVSCGPTYYIPYPFPGYGDKEDAIKPDTSWQTEASGSSETDPFVLSTVGDVRGLAAMVESGHDYEGQYFTLAANEEYDFSDIPNFQIGLGDRKDMEGSNVFRGVFDGNGATISGLNISAGGDGSEDNTPYGFIAVAENATIKNLNFENCTINADSSSTGLAVGYAENCNIENITAENCTITGAEGTGAIAGRLYITEGGEYYIRNNTNINSSVITNGTYHAGGIIGYVNININIKDPAISNTTVKFDNNTVILSSGKEISCIADKGIATAGAIAGSIGGWDGNTTPGRVPFEFTDNTITLDSLNQIKANGPSTNYRGLLYSYSTVDGIPDVDVNADDNNTFTTMGDETVIIVSNITPEDGQIANFISE